MITFCHSVGTGVVKVVDDAVLDQVHQGGVLDGVDRKNLALAIWGGISNNKVF